MVIFKDIFDFKVTLGSGGSLLNMRGPTQSHRLWPEWCPATHGLRGVTIT